MKHILQPAEGEVLKLGPPAAGEVVIKVDSQQAGAPFAAGTRTLLPGAEIPSHRHLHRHEILFVHKGQGRVILDGQSMTALPGTMIIVPKQSWWSLRNTGTGLLHLAWVSEPGGVEVFFRELSSAGTSAGPDALKEIAQRHGIELGAEDAVVAQAPEPGRRHRRRRGGRGHGGPARPAPQTSSAPQSQAAASPAPAQPAMDRPLPSLPASSRGAGQAGGLPAPRGGGVSTSVRQAGGRRRRRRGRGGGSGRPPAQQQPAAGTGPVVPPVAAGARAGSGSGPKPPAVGAARPGGPPARRGERKGGGGRPRRFGRVKEVYMGGKWVRVVGEGPVISGEAASANKEELDA